MNTSFRWQQMKIPGHSRLAPHQSQTVIFWPLSSRWSPHATAVTIGGQSGHGVPWLPWPGVSARICRSSLEFSHLSGRYCSPMKQLRTPDQPDIFERVRKAALALPDVEATIRYDGSPVLKAGGVYMAGLASHPSAEPATLVVKIAIEERDAFLEDAPETYYLTDSYRPHPVVLVRLPQIDQAALRDLLSIAWRAIAARSSVRRRSRNRSSDMGLFV
jgi:hypothetical protein